MPFYDFYLLHKQDNKSVVQHHESICCQLIPYYQIAILTFITLHIIC